MRLGIMWGGANSQIVVPMGAWNIGYQCTINVANTLGNTNGCRATLATSANTQTDTELSNYFNSNNGGNDIIVSFSSRKLVKLTSSQTYYLNIWGAVVNFALSLTNSSRAMVLDAICAYL